MTAAEAYAARIDAVEAQAARLRQASAAPDLWGESVLRRFPPDPRRPSTLSCRRSPRIYRPKLCCSTWGRRRTRPASPGGALLKS
jgi:hypothetical protein